MAESLVQTPVNKNSEFDFVFVEKATEILDLIYAHLEQDPKCTHCQALLRSGLEEPTSPEPDAENTKPVTKRFGYV